MIFPIHVSQAMKALRAAAKEEGVKLDDSTTLQILASRMCMHVLGGVGGSCLVHSWLSTGRGCCAAVLGRPLIIVCGTASLHVSRTMHA